MSLKRSLTFGVVVAAALARGSVFAQQAGSGQQPPPAAQPSSGSQPGATQPTTGPAPKLELHPTDFRFGEVWQGLPAEREFTVKNVGAGPMNVEVTSSCGCTVVSKPKSPLDPGESSTFKIAYQTSNLGPTDKRVTVTTNDPSQSNVEIPVQGTVKPLYEITPTEHIVFQELDRDSQVSGSVRIESKYDKPLNMKVKPDQALSAFEVALREIQPGREYELVATTKPPLEVGWNIAAVLVETGLADAAPITVHLSASVPPRVALDPARLFVTPQFTQPMQHTVRVDYRKSEPVNITDVQCDLPAVQFEVMPPCDPPEGSRLAFREIRVTVPGFRELPPGGAQLYIFTDAEGELAKLTVSIERRLPPQRRGPKYPPRPVNPAPAASQPSVK
jgi:hypothetical protein